MMQSRVNVAPFAAFRFLGIKQAQFSFDKNGPLIAVNGAGAERIVVDDLGRPDLLRQGWLFAELRVPTESGTTRIKWLPKKVGRSTKRWLRTYRYLQLAPDIARKAAQIRSMLALGYLRESRFQHLRSLAKESRKLFSDLPDTDQVTESQLADFRLVAEVADWGLREKAAHNEQYLNEQLAAFSGFFDTLEKHPMTASQRRACIVDEDNNLVLAGAGTGKTSTMIGRACFLVNSGQCKPDQILMLAFARKAADEMQQRLSERVEGQGIVASTFHKLGKEIIARVEGAQPSVSPLAEDDSALAALVNEWFEEKMGEPRYRKKAIAYFDNYLYPATNPFEFEHEGEYFDFILANDIRTLKGEVVKGYGECQIANHLFKLGVDYRYEAPYEHATRSLEFRQYQPDFYLPEYGIYLEHVGIDRSGNTAPFVDREAYQRGMDWKRQLHQQKGTVLLESYHYELTEGTLLLELERKLEEAGVVFDRLPEESVLETLRDFGAVSSFAALLAQLLRRFKACHLDQDQVTQLIRHAESPKQIAAALDLLAPILDAYQAKLDIDQQIDFDDMIGRAILYVEQGRYKSKWRFILVDEFQDISEPRARLVRALRGSAADSSLFCVGDDWQAIYRFTGSDIALTTDFEAVFGATEITALDKTFRFNDSISDVASSFVQQNPSQLKKTLKTLTQVDRPAVSIMRKSPTRGVVDSRLLEVLAKISEQAEAGSTVYLLARFGFTVPDFKIMRAIQKKYANLEISSVTMHGSKGKEADYVVLLGLESGKHGFPSQKATHPLLEALLPKAEPYRYAEERRLLYVALTRARHRAYLICDMASASEFVKELIKGKYKIELEEFETSLAQKLFESIACNACSTGSLVPRKGKHGNFYGCTHYPLCDNSENGCRACGNPMQRLGRFKVCISPDCESWVPTCPKCGAEMVERRGVRGRFWGCRNYRGQESVSCAHTENEISYDLR